MKTSQEFYQLLNQSIEPTENQQYVRETTTMMKSLLLTRTKPKNALILGAGRMGDLSIDFFLREFDQVTVTDIDDFAMNLALEEGKKEKIHVRQMDYLGLDQIAFFRDFDQLLTIQDNHEDIRLILEEKMRRIKTYKFSMVFQDHFDFIYLSPIYTQLFYVQVEQWLKIMVSKGLKKEAKDFILSIVLQEMIGVIDHFNGQVVDLVTPGGLVFVGSDIFTIKEDSFSRKIKNSIESKEVMEEIYLEYHKNYGFGLGDYGLYSIEQSLEKIRSRWLLWKQSKQQTYAVKFCAFEKIENTLGG